MRTITISALLILVGCSSKTSATDSGAWWSDGSSDTTPSGGEVDGDDDDDNDDDDEEDEPIVGQFFWGEVSTSEGWGAVGFFSASSAESVDCEEEIEASSVEAITDCAECSSAFALNLGEREIYEGDEAGCAASPYGDLSNTTFKVGVSGESLFIDTGSGWEQVADGIAELEGDELFFAIGEEE